MFRLLLPVYIELIFLIITKVYILLFLNFVFLKVLEFMCNTIYQYNKQSKSISYFVMNPNLYVMK